MPLFTYVASKKDGTIVEEEIETKDQASVVAYLEKHDYFPVSVKEKKVYRSLSISFSSKITLLEKVTFARNLALMIKSGIGMSEAVAILLEDAERAPLRKVLSKIKADLEKGLQLSAALETFPSQFSTVFISLLRAGETSGNLEMSLLQIATQLKKENDLKKKVLSAMAYPAILLSLAFGVVALLVTVVLPRVSKIFTQAHVQLPLLTRILLGISDFVASQFFATLAIIAGIVAIIALARRSSAGKRALQVLFIKTPLIAPLMKKIALVRFTGTLHSLMKAGVPLTKALEITAQAIGNASYRQVLLDIAKNEISKGISFGMALKQRPEYFPRLTSSMIVIGEKSGNLENVLENLSSFYEEEVDGTIKSLITILEPALLLCIGLIIGAIALSIVMPIYQMINVVR
ncbi:type II secretion system F family protein [Candidatus Azambacteria bacterium]|nr:type II secretion system F family protein [Candidatus Azambacteria bacterium]